MNKNAQKNEESEKRIEALNQRIDNLKGKLK